jgi:very-short-patch-repair endonuclease
MEKFMFNTIIGFAFVLIVIGLLAVYANKGKQGKKGKEGGLPAPIRATIPLTLNEQPMYFRLAEAFPDHVVLAQVAFSALLSCKDNATRNRFDRKRADFVLCTKAFEVVAVVELDDSSHKGREEQDASRDKYLKDAGYWVLRYKQVPDVADLQRDVAMINAKGRPKMAA